RHVRHRAIPVARVSPRARRWATSMRVAEQLTHLITDLDRYLLDHVDDGLAVLRRNAAARRDELIDSSDGGRIRPGADPARADSSPSAFGAEIGHGPIPLGSEPTDRLSVDPPGVRADHDDLDPVAIGESVPLGAGVQIEAL